MAIIEPDRSAMEAIDDAVAKSMAEKTAAAEDRAFTREVTWRDRVELWLRRHGVLKGRGGVRIVRLVRSAKLCTWLKTPRWRDPERRRTEWHRDRALVTARGIRYELTPLGLANKYLSRVGVIMVLTEDEVLGSPMDWVAVMRR